MLLREIDDRLTSSLSLEIAWSFLVDKLMEFYAIMPSVRGIAFIGRDFRGIFLSEKVPKKHFGTAVAKTAA